MCVPEISNEPPIQFWIDYFISQIRIDEDVPEDNVLSDGELTEEELRDFDREFDEQSDDEYWQTERESYSN